MNAPSWEETEPVGPSWDDTEPVEASHRSSDSFGGRVANAVSGGLAGAAAGPLGMAVGGAAGALLPSDAVQNYRESMAYKTSPVGMLESIPPLFSKVASKAGQFATEEISKGRGAVDPVTAGIVGTGISMSPDITMLSGPHEANPERGAIDNAAVGMTRRAIGYPKTELKTPFARGQVTDAARVALENKMVPWLGDTQVIGDRANEMMNRSGQKLNEMRGSVGPQPIDPVFAQLQQLRNRLTQGGARGGDWNDVHSLIDNAETTLRGLSGSKANTPMYESAPEAAVRATPASQLALPEPRRPMQTPGPVSIEPVQNVDPALYVKEFGRGQTPSKADLQRFKLQGWERVNSTDGSFVYANPDYLASLPPDFNAIGSPVNRPAAQPNVDFPHGNADYYGVDVNPPPPPPRPEPQRIDRIDLNSVEAAKNRGQEGVRYAVDSTQTQSDKKSLAHAVESGIEQILRHNGVDMAAYKEQKRLYGASKSIFKATNNEIGAQQGNKVGRMSLFGTVSDLMGRRVPGFMGRAAYETAKVGNRLNATTVGATAGSTMVNGALTESKAREYLKRAGGDKAKARQLATQEGWAIPR